MTWLDALRTLSVAHREALAVLLAGGPAERAQGQELIAQIAEMPEDREEWEDWSCDIACMVCAISQADAVTIWRKYPAEDWFHDSKKVVVAVLIAEDVPLPIDNVDLVSIINTALNGTRKERGIMDREMLSLAKEVYALARATPGDPAIKRRADDISLWRSAFCEDDWGWRWLYTAGSPQDGGTLKAARSLMTWRCLLGLPLDLGGGA